MVPLPKETSDRKIGNLYLFKNRIVTWNGTLIMCKQHNKEIGLCVPCSTVPICRHGKITRTCAHCKGKKCKKSFPLNKKAQKKTKKCVDCKQTLQIANFSIQQTSTDGYQSWCKECNKKRFKISQKYKWKPKFVIFVVK